MSFLNEAAAEENIEGFGLTDLDDASRPNTSVTRETWKFILEDQVKFSCR